MWNFKGYLWNSTQNILPIYWKMLIVFTIANLRALRFKSAQVFLKRPPEHTCPTLLIVLHWALRHLKRLIVYVPIHFIATCVYIILCISFIAYNLEILAEWWQSPAYGNYSDLCLIKAGVTFVKSITKLISMLYYIPCYWTFIVTMM